MSSQDLSQRLHLPGRAIALVVAGGRSDGLPGDSSRAPQAHFGGRFRSVDFALSNCLNSGIRRIGVLSPHRSHSLQRHLKRSWSFLKGDASEFIELLLPEQQRTGAETAHARPALGLTSHRDLLAGSNAEFVLVLTGDRIYKMNYASMLADHLAKGRDCTVACIEASPTALQAGTWMTVDAQWHITDAVDSFDGPLARSNDLPPGPAGKKERALLSMGIYIFNRDYLLAELARDAADNTAGHVIDRDIDREIVAQAVRSGRASAHPFALSCIGTPAGKAPYWRDVGTIDAYWDANIDLTASLPQLDLYDPNWPIRAQQAELAPAKFLHNEADRRGMAIESLVSGGSIISGSVLRSVLFPSVRVHSYASVEWSVLLPAVQVGRHARLRRVVVERGCTIPDGLVIGEDANADAARFFRTDRGITLVTADMLARLLAPLPASLPTHLPTPPPASVPAQANINP